MAPRINLFYLNLQTSKAVYQSPSIIHYIKAEQFNNLNNVAGTVDGLIISLLFQSLCNACPFPLSLPQIGGLVSFRFFFSPGELPAISYHGCFAYFDG
jgi:hypothetical protein